MRALLLIYIYIPLWFSCIVGCQGPLAEQRMAVDRTYHTAVDNFVHVSRAYSSAADTMADKKHEAQTELQDRIWSSWLDKNTNPDGTLTLSREDMDAAIASRDDARAAMATSKMTWTTVHTSFIEALGKFQALSTGTLETKEDLAEAEATAQSFLDTTLKSLAGILSGLGLGLAL